ncbi:MAG: ABC transporter permease [Solirubrobacterales bacterium]
MRANLITVWALVRRSGNELLRVPGAAIPGVLAPTIFFLGITSVFGNLTNLPGFTSDSFQSFMVPVSLMQGASFTGAAQGVNLARDIEAGWFDRLLASPAPRWVLLGGIMASAALRSLIPGAVVLLVAMATGAHFPGLLGLAIATVVVMGVAAISSTWGSVLALKFKSQSAAPLMQAGMLLAIFLTTAFAPLVLLQGWLQTVARYNPLTQVLEAARQGFIGSVSWADTWPGLLALAGIVTVLTLVALRGMRRITVE